MRHSFRLSLPTFMQKIALISEHASPLACIGSVDSGGQNALHRLCGASGHTTHTDLIFNELLAALSKIGKSGAELTTMQGILPLHIICGAGSHTHTTYRIFTELLVLFKGSSLVASTKEKEVSARM